MQNGESAIDATQVLLTAYDVGLSKAWRNEDRQWRKQDVDWREQEQEYLQQDYAFMQQERRWRQVDVEQTQLDNARYLWQKFVEKNKREVEEKAGQLRAISSISALLAGFAMVAFLEMQFTYERPHQVPKYRAVLPLHGLSTGATVAVEMTCVVMCTLMLSGVLRLGHSFVGEAEEAEFMLRCRNFASTYRPFSRPPAPSRSFSAHWAVVMETQWRRVVRLFALGLPLFCLQLAMAAWVKFWQSPLVAVLVSALMGVTVVLLMLLQCVWGQHLLHQDESHLAADRYDQAPMGLPFDWHLKPQPPPIWRPSTAHGAAAEQGTGAASHVGLPHEAADICYALPQGMAPLAEGRQPVAGGPAGSGADWRAGHHWHRQDYTPPVGDSILQWTLPGQLLLWAVEALQHAIAWVQGTQSGRSPLAAAALHCGALADGHAVDRRPSSESDGHVTPPSARIP